MFPGTPGPFFPPLSFKAALPWHPLLSCTSQGGTPGVGVNCPKGMAVESYAEQGGWRWGVRGWK